eukprot:528214-Prorocentrum_minimum.AAC.1
MANTVNEDFYRIISPFFYRIYTVVTVLYRTVAVCASCLPYFPPYWPRTSIKTVILPTLQGRVPYQRTNNSGRVSPAKLARPQCRQPKATLSLSGSSMLYESAWLQSITTVLDAQ